MLSVRLVEALLRIARSAVVNGTVIVLADLIPLAGVLWWGWDVFVIVLLYWLENGVVGFFNELKIRRIEGPTVGFSMSGFFLMHYGAFWIGHGVFVLLLPSFMGESWNLAGVSVGSLALAFSALVISHASEYLLVFLRERRWVGADPQRQMLEPYPRLITLHIVIVAGAVVASTLGQPLWLVVLLVLFKTAFDLGVRLVTARPSTAYATNR